MSIQKKTTTHLGFDYKALKPEPAAELQKAARKIRNEASKTVMMVGEILIEVKDLVKHGEFRAWVSAELGFSPRTAERYMSAAKFAAECDIVSHLTSTSIYLLASPSTPQSVRDDVAARLFSNEKVTAKDVRSMIEDVKPSAQCYKVGQHPQKVTSSIGSAVVKRSPPALSFRMAAKVQKLIESGNSPANSEVFWAKVRRKEDGLVIVHLRATTPK
jgi:hypothetical protein